LTLILLIEKDATFRPFDFDITLWQM